MKNTILKIKQRYLNNLEVVKKFEDDFSFRYKNIPIKHKSFKDLIKFVNKKLSSEEVNEIYEEIKKIVFKARK